MKRVAQKRLAIEWHLAMEGRTGKDVMSEAELCVEMEDVSRIKRLFEDSLLTAIGSASGLFGRTRSSRS